MRNLADTVKKHVSEGKAWDTSELSESARLYAKYLASKECECEEARIAFEIHKDRMQREILEALLIGKCPDSEIHTAFRVPLKSIAIYRELFFDPANFSTDLERISYIESYGDSFGRELKLRAVNLGYEYVLYTYGSIVPRTAAQRALVQKMFLSSAYKAMNINYAAMTSATMKAAVEHGKLMLKAYETLERINSEDNNESYNLVDIIPAEDTSYDTYKKLDGELA